LLLCIELGVDVAPPKAPFASVLVPVLAGEVFFLRLWFILKQRQCLFEK
jgi:hypothetical protein